MNLDTRNREGACDDVGLEEGGKGEGDERGGGGLQ